MGRPERSFVLSDVTAFPPGHVWDSAEGGEPRRWYRRAWRSFDAVAGVAADRPRLREADLRRHIIAQSGVKDDVLEADTTPDPRFTATAAQLEKKGVKDFQLDYAIRTLTRLAGPVAAKPKVAAR